jgi:hypothetical protein
MPFTARPDSVPARSGKSKPYGRIAALVALVIALGGGGVMAYKYLGNAAVVRR